MKALRTVLLAFLPALLVGTAGWSAKPDTQNVKGYTTKRGKIVKPYSRSVKPRVEAAKPKAMPEHVTTPVKPKPVLSKPKPKPVPTTSVKKPAPVPSGEKTVHVRGYTTKSGKVVQPYMRRAPTKKTPPSK